MKKTLKILSLICAIVLIIGTVSVGLTAFAVSDDAIGDYDFTISNVYKDIDWSNVTAYKSATHVHTVRSDADTEIDDMIHYYYDDFGYDAMALTDHGTVNYGWDHDQTRVVLYDYQWFVHGTMDQLSESDYKNIITGARNSRGYGMMEIPMGIEWNGASTKKYHVNGYYVDAGHGDLSILDNQDDAILGAIKGNYNAGGFSHVNHVGEWSGGNDEPTVYSQSWVENFASYFERYCPNKGGRGAASQGTKGVIGIELVNTADSRTHNDRRYVYDEILKVLAPQGINVFGFCEDDAHEKSDCDRNAQYFLINNNKDVKITSAQFDASNNTSGSSCDYQNNNNDPMDKVQNYYREAMFYGEFYASSKNSKNSYELGNGFNAVGNYPSISNISVDNDKDQISVSFKDATKIRLVADGVIIDTVKTDNGTNTVVFDLNRYEHQINSYVRIYLTGAGGITYLQPFLVTKTQSHVSTVQFVSDSLDDNGEYNVLPKDAEVVVKDSNGSVVSNSLTYENFFYKLGAGNYTYTATRRGYMPVIDKAFTVTQAQIDAGEQIKIPVTLEESSDVTYGYFYAPETIYLTTNDDSTFDKYVDRENADNGAIHTDLRNTGNVYFHREGASDIEIKANAIEGDVLFDYITVNGSNVITNPITASGSTVSTSITAGKTHDALANDQYILIQWEASYTYNELPYKAYTYTYVYKTPTGKSVSLGAGAYVKTKKNITSWAHSTMYVAASIYAAGITKLEHNNTDGTSYGGYRFAPNSGFAFDDYSTDLRIDGSGYTYKSEDSSGGSVKIEIRNTDVGYIYVDRSRINNWKDIPYLKIGFDLNDVDETTGDGGDSGSYGVARFLFDTTLTGARDATYHSDDVLFNLYFPNNKSNYIQVTDYNLSDGTASTVTGSVSNCLESYGSKRLYMSDNTDSSKAIVKALPSASASEVTVPLGAYVKGTKESRRDEIALEIDLCLVNLDKSALRTEFNNTNKDAFQKDWFQSEAEWNNYETVVKDAGKVLGNPGATQEQIDNATTALQEVYDNFTLKQGTYTVQYIARRPGAPDRMIYTNTTQTYDVVTFEYTNDISVNAPEITGYTFANSFQCYAQDGEEAPFLVDEGEDDFDIAFAEHDIYIWKFYYTPNSFDVKYNVNEADGEEDFTDTVYFGEPYTVLGEGYSRTGYKFIGITLDLDDKLYQPGNVIPSWKWNIEGEFTVQWESNKVSVTYDADNNDTPLFRVTDEYKTATYGTSYSIYDKVPEKAGYEFIGWNLNGETHVDPATGQPEIDEETGLPMVDENGNPLPVLHTAGTRINWTTTVPSTFKAYWKVAEYTVDFVTNYDDFDLTDYTITVKYDEPYGELPTYSRTGYTLEWYADPNFAPSAKAESSTNVFIDDDHTLYAKWVPINYNITYNDNGGVFAIDNPTTYNVETPDFTLHNPVKTGYNFLGWSGNGISGYSTNYTFDCSANTGDKTFTANWELLGYEITYDLNYGTGIQAYNDARNPDSYTMNDVADGAITIYPPTRTGYSFAGWTGSNGTIPQTDVTIAKGSTGLKEYTANWNIINYTISYDYNGADVTPTTNPTEYNVETPTFTLAEPQKTGYVFSGWDSSNNDYDASTVTIEKGTATDNLTFKAMWDEQGSMKITYVLNGGRVEGYNPNSYKEGIDAFTLINPVRNGYSFAGWNKNGGSATMTGSVTKGDTGELTFVANWTPLEAVISYNLAGGSIVADGQNPTSYYPDYADFTLINPVRAGYTFAGWTGTGLNGATVNVTIPTGSYGERSYTATWRANSYNVNYNFNGGTDTGLIKSYTPATSAVINAPAKPGSTFTGWNIAFDSFEWTENKAINNSGKMVAQTGAYCSDPVSLQSGFTYTVDGSASGLKIYVFSSDLTSFIGAYTGSYTATSDCVAFLSTGSEQLSNLRAVSLKISGTTPLSYSIKTGSAGDMSFTANWADNTYNITYTGLDGARFNGSATNPNPATYNYNSSNITLINPEKTGYTFTGWSYNGSVNKNVTISNHSTGDRTYEAIWEITNYSISYNGLEGAAGSANRTSYTINDAFSLNNPTKTGYTFTGWIGTGLPSSGSMSVSVAAGSTGDRTYTATWNAVPYTITYVLDGGTNNASNPSTYTVDTETFSLAAPTKTGATFAGWQGTGIDGTSANVTISKGSTENKTYTAVWDIITYNISYDLAGGTGTNPTTYNVASENITLKAPTRTGYVFKGWTGTGLSAASTSVTIPTGSTGNRAYTATWQAENYRITYNLDGGQIADNANPATYNIESATIVLENPVRAGYTFAGWTGTDLTAASTEVTIQRGSTGNRTYTATWNEERYTITYSGIDFDGVSFIGENKTYYNIDTETFTLYNPERTGYTFTGWSGTEISGTGISSSVTINKGSTGNRSYTAHWELATYSIYCELNGGTETIANPTSYNYLSAPITLYAPVKTGFVFEGWTGTGLDGTVSSVTIPTNSTGDRVYNAVWGEGNYTITLDPNEGTLPAGQSTTINYTVNTATFTIPNAERTGYTFVGWTGTGLSGSTVVDLEIPQGSTGNRTYTAVWTAAQNSITYNLNGGEITNGSNPSGYDTNSGTLTIISPVKDGYKFNGWNVVSGDSNVITVNSLNKSIKINTANGGSFSLAALWTPLNYRITYNLNGGSVATANPTSYNITTPAFTLNKPTRTGYVFEGWSGTGLDNYKYETVTISEETGNRTYTANWSEATYHITYDYNGGSLKDGSNPVDYKVTSDSFTLINPVRTGYEFLGWTGSNGTTPQTVVTIATGSTGDRTYTAQFGAIEYDITYLGVADADFTPVKTKYTAADESFSIGAPARDGYTFAGWTSADILNPVASVTIAKGSSGNKTFTANWTPVKYTITYVLGGGKVNGDNPDSYTIESSKIVLINPEKAGYSFVGWTSEDYAEPTDTAIINKGSFGNKTFTAVWDTSFTISYSGVTADEKLLYNLPSTYSEGASVTINNPARAGYTFQGWTGTGLTAKTKDLVLPAGSTGNKSYTANWIIRNYDLDVDLDGGEAATSIPSTFTINSDKIVLPTPKKEGYTFVGWSGTNISGTAPSVVIEAGSTGDRAYTAVWSERTGDTHKIYFYGYEGYPIIFNDGKTYKEQEIGKTIIDPLVDPNENINVTVGYQITGWDIDFNSDRYVNLNDDIEVHATTAYGPDTYSVVVNGSETVTATCTQYEKYTAITDLTNASGKKFSYWVAIETDKNGNETREIASFYRNYVFYVHSDVTLLAVYGDTTSLRATTRVSFIEGYDPNYDWFTVYAERNVGTELTVVQHGVIFTDDSSKGTSSGLQIGNGVYNAVASSKNLTGIWTVSIPNPHQYGPVIYTRSYVKVADSSGKVSLIYSDIKTYTNNEDPTP